MRLFRFLSVSVVCVALLTACPAPPAKCSTATDCSDGDACTTDSCTAGACEHAALAVDDGNGCTVDSCDPIVGVSHAAVAIDDANACTTDACDPVTGVSHAAVTSDDGDACTTDSCDPTTGVAHTPVAIDDTNACTADACNATTGEITHVATVTDDTNACTTDACDPATGAVTHDAVALDDQDACTVDACDPTTGVSHAAVAVDDTNACTIDACNSTTGAITHVAAVTDDQNACTTDACNSTTGVITHVAVAVDDGNACTTDACNTTSGAISHVAVNVDDANTCTTDACDPTSGNVTHVAVAVNDFDACTTDACDTMTGFVTHVAVNTDDSDACTTDSCSAMAGVSHLPISIDDSDACTTDACAPSTGVVSHVAVAIDDGDACTTDSCTPSTGAISHVAVTVDDGDACTTDSCNPSTGTSHVAVSVDDGDACTTDSCSSSTGVISHAAVNVDDGDVCTTDSCSPSTGLSHVAVNVDDGVPCTTDACSPASGVSHTPVDSVCELDGFSCTVAVCSPVSGCSETASPVLCDDSVSCTTDACVGAGGAATTGCVNAPRDLSCGVLEACVTGGCGTPAAGSQAGRLVITEFRALGAEFIELYNASGAPIDLHGFTLRNAADQRATLRDPSDRALGVGTPVILAPGAYAWGVANPSGSVIGAPTFLFGDPGTPFLLSDSGDQLLIYDGAGRLEDAVDFRALHTDPNLPMTATSWPAFAGRSTQLGTATPSATANDASSAWCVSFFSLAQRRRADASAGSANTRCDTFVINEALIDATGAEDTKTFVELAGPGGAVIGGVKLVELEGLGGSAGARNADGDQATGDVDGEFVVPAGTRVPVDGILLIADANTAVTSTSVPNFVAGVDVLATDMDLENNGGDALQLLSSTGALLDTIGYESAGQNLATNTAFNGLAMYETATALYPPTGMTLSRSPLSDDTDDNRNDFRADPSPTPGLPNDFVSVTVTGVVPSSGVANTGTLAVTVQGTDFVSGTTLTFGATPATCAVTSATRMTCAAVSSVGATVGAVNVTATPPASVGPPFVLTNGFTWTGVLNETDANPEADYCVLQFPTTATGQSGTSVTVFGRIFETGVTEAGGADSSVRAELGYGPASPTSFQGWTWTPATFNAQYGNDDEYMADLVVPVVTSSTDFSYTMRFSFDGLNWTYCDTNGAGSNSGLTLELTQLGVLTATP